MVVWQQVYNDMENHNTETRANPIKSSAVLWKTITLKHEKVVSVMENHIGVDMENHNTDFASVMENHNTERVGVNNLSDRLIEVYLERREKEIRQRVNSLPWNKAFHARMKAAGEAYKKRRQERAEDE